MRIRKPMTYEFWRIVYKMDLISSQHLKEEYHRLFIKTGLDMVYYEQWNF